MKGHHIRFYATYSGKQPTDPECSIKKVGRGYWSKHIWKRQTYSIIAGTKTIEILLEHDGALDTVKQKLDYCQETVDRIGRVFAERHMIELTSPFELGGYSHWVVDHKRTSDMLKPLCDKPKNDRVGALHDDSSHPGLVEFIGPESVKGAEGMDGLLIELPTMINALYSGQVAFRQDVKVLLGAWGDSIKRQDETQRMMAEIIKLLGEKL